MKTNLIRPLVAAACALIVNAALAVDTPNTPTAAPDSAEALGTARALVAEQKWSDAIAELRRVNDSGNADWNNLMGYSLRKSSPPDLVAAERHYNEALRLNPKHRGALEYSGELYLMLGDMARVEQRLNALDKACFLPCEEFTDLKKAVARYKANGNKYVPARN